MQCMDHSPQRVLTCQPTLLWGSLLVDTPKDVSAIVSMVKDTHIRDMIMTVLKITSGRGDAYIAI